MVLGRYVAEFADLCWTLRYGLTRAGRIAGQPARTIRALSDELPAARLAEAFFDMCAALKDYTPEEASVALELHDRVIDAVERRDAYMNGDWWAGWTSADARRGGVAAPWVRDRAKQVEPDVLVHNIDDLVELRCLLEQFVVLVSGDVHALAPGVVPMMPAQRREPMR